MVCGQCWDAADNVYTCSSGQALVRGYSLGLSGKAITSNDYTGTNGSFTFFRQVDPKPLINIQLTNGLVKLSWPQTFSDFRLQSLDNLNAGLWKTNLGSTSVDGTNLFITQPATNLRQFYRLTR